jgi:tetratricopeptide (TPR) repeat protein
MRGTSLALSAAIVCTLLIAGGCGESNKIVVVTYDFPAKYQVPESVKKVAVAPFESAYRDHWGTSASDKLVAELDKANKKFQRYRLFDRTRLSQVMAERDVKLAAVASAEEAQRIGKTADVDALIFGKVAASFRDTQLFRQVYDPALKTTKSVPYTQRTVQVIVTCSMIDVGTTRTIAAESYSESWDSEKEGAPTGLAAFARAMGGGGDDKLPSPDKIMNDLVDRCVQKFTGTISPVERSFSIKLDNGPKQCAQGNTLAAAGDYDAAIQCYNQVLAQKPNDAAVLFNLGMMYEAKRDLDKAQDYFRQAIAQKDSQKYAEGLQRVRSMSALAGKTEP